MRMPKEYNKKNSWSLMYNQLMDVGTSYLDTFY